MHQDRWLHQTGLVSRQPAWLYEVRGLINQLMCAIAGRREVSLQQQGMQPLAMPPQSTSVSPTGMEGGSIELTPGGGLVCVNRGRLEANTPST